MENGNEKRDLERRLSRLEERVKELEYRLEVEKSSVEKGFFQTPGSEAGDEGMDWGESLPVEDAAGSGVWGEDWLNRIGLGLLLLGVAFLFKYSIDQGWLVPPVRSAIGLMIGLSLFIPGLQMGEDRTPMREILLGGGIAAFYITGFATFQLYEFAPGFIVWAFMIVVTLLALSLSLQHNQAILSVTGIIGGLGTPFMLYTGSGSLSGLVIYTTLVLAAGAMIYMKKGWNSLLWCMAAGGILVYMVGMAANILQAENPALADRWALQLGIIAGALVFWIAPVIREVLSKRDPQQWPHPYFHGGKEEDSGAILYIPSVHVNIMSIVIPVFLLLYSMGLWDLSDRAWGGVALAFALPVGYAYLPLQREELSKLASMHAFSALALLTISLALLFEGNLLLAAFALEAAGLRYIAARGEESIPSAVSHMIFGIIFLWMAGAMLESGFEGRVPFNADAFIRLGVILVAGVLVPKWLEEKSVRVIYRVTAHLALLGWLYNTFIGFDNGQAFVSAAWGIYSVALLASGFSWEKKWLRAAGMATIFLVIGKLFIVDLSQLQAIWRILLFIGFGGLLLVIGYLVQFKWNKSGD